MRTLFPIRIGCIQLANKETVDSISQLYNKKGIDFYAKGNKPSWSSLNMGFEKGFYFKTFNGIDINAPPVDGKKAMDINVLRFSAEIDSTIRSHYYFGKRMQ